MFDAAVQWSLVEGAVRFSWPAGFLETPAGRGLEVWIDEWQAADDSESQLTITFGHWHALGQPPPHDANEEERDLFAARHGAIARLLGVRSQRIALESIGHIGAPDVSFVFAVDGARVGEATHPKPFPKDGRGHAHALLPAAFEVYARLCAWNARGSTTRAEQLVFLAELRDHLERAREALAESVAPLHYELDEHLSAFRASRPSSLSLGWTARKQGAMFDLTLEEVGPDGEHRPLDLNKLDAESPILEVSSTEHILLDPDADAVARVARKQRNKLRKHVEPYFHSPASLIPEGVSLEKVDLGAYSPRVLGFEPIIKAERFTDIKSSGVGWYESDGDTGQGAFLRLFITQPAGGGIEVLEIATPEEAAHATTQLAEALRQPVPEAVTIGGKRVAPTQPLLDKLQQEVEKFRAREASAGEAPPPELARRLAAKISDEVQPAAKDAPREVEVPWPQLAALLKPGVQLKDHQRSGLEWLWSQYKSGASGVLLADDMGLGKTLQVSAFLALQRATEPERKLPSLLVAPVILLENWRDELEKFFQPHVFRSLVVLYGAELRRRKAGGSLHVGSLREADYVLTNYETLQAHQQSLLLLDWNVVVLDEAQAIKNRDTYRARAARGLKRVFGICSTGTPVENRLGDLWSIYDFLSPGDPFTTPEEFQRDFEDDPAGTHKIRERLRYPGRTSSLLRRTKEEVLKDLPKKTIQVHAVAMTDHQVQLEREVVRTGEESGKPFAILQGLQKLYQHPRLLVPEANRDVGLTVETALAESPKLRLCMQILRGIQAAGEKALVFTLWTSMQAMLVDTIKHELGLRLVRVINGDPAQRSKAGQYLREFREVDAFNVIVLSPLAAGTGLTITAANHVIHYGRWWNPAKEDQATDRAYRIGQERPVTVHYPLLHHPGSEGRGFDVKLHELVEKKRAMARDFLAPQPEEAITAADLAALKQEA